MDNHTPEARLQRIIAMVEEQLKDSGMPASQCREIMDILLSDMEASVAAAENIRVTDRELEAARNATQGPRPPPPSPDNK